MDALARLMGIPTKGHKPAALGLVHYPAGTAQDEITWERRDFAEYSDAKTRVTWARGGPQLTGYVFLMFMRAVSCSSRLQPNIAASTIEE